MPNYLYVEDDRLSREVMHVLLRDVAGISSYTIFETSENFLDNLRALPERPDVILLDVHVTPINGFEMLALIREEPGYEQCKVIALTASVMNEEVQQLRTAGFDGTLGKPLDVMTFYGLLERIQMGEAVWQIM